MTDGAPMTPGLGRALAVGAEVGVEIRVGCGVADGGLLGLITWLHPVSATIAHTATIRNPRRGFASGISATLNDNPPREPATSA